jgi:hypothetical protein
VEKIKKIIETSGEFSSTGKRSIKNHVFALNHHVMTTKNHVICTSFFQTPLQKHQQKQQNPGLNRGLIFFEINRT